MLHLMIPALVILSSVFSPAKIPIAPLSANVLEDYISSKAAEGHTFTFREGPTAPEYRYYLGPLWPPQKAELQTVRKGRYPIRIRPLPPLCAPASAQRLSCTHPNARDR